MPGRASARRSSGRTSSNTPTSPTTSCASPTASQLNAILDPIFATQTTAVWRDRFHEAAALFGPIFSVPEAVEQEQVLAGDLVTTVEHATLGAIPQLQPAIDMGDTPGGIQSPPPLLGEHGPAILAEIGYDEQAIAALVADGTLLVTAPDEVAV